MRRIESAEDQMKGIVTYELSSGQRIVMDARMAREIGAAEVLRQMGHGELIPTERVPVVWHGQVAGTVPGDFDPLSIKSKNFFYDPRPGDFVRDGEKWVASRMLGPGDLEAVPGFEWDSAFGISPAHK